MRRALRTLTSPNGPLRLRSRLLALGLPVLVVTAWTAAPPARPADRSPQALRPAGRDALERAYRANNEGVAWLEQYRYGEAEAAFRRALAIDDSLAIARLNLALALLYGTRTDEAIREATAAARALPDLPHPHYVLGLLARLENELDTARRHFQRVRALDPDDEGTKIQLGQILLQEQRFDEAAALLREAVEAEPYNATATYSLGMALTRAGQREEGQRTLARFQELSGTAYATTYAQTYLQQGRYAEGLVSTGAEPALVNREPPALRYVDETPAAIAPSRRPRLAGREIAFGRPLPQGPWTATTRRALASSLGGSATLVDYDGDGDLDLVAIGPDEERLLRNDRGRLIDVTREAGLGSPPADAVGLGAVAADYDNDGLVDLFVLRYGTSALYRQDRAGHFTSAVRQAGIAPYPYLALSAAFVDVDHDGDVDLFVAGCADLETVRPGAAGGGRAFPDAFARAPNRLLRNDGDGTFTDITEAAGVGGSTGCAVALVPTDYDNRRDVDLLVVHHGPRPALFRNQRDGTFRDVAAGVGLDVSGRFTSATAADVDKDGSVDLFLGRAGSRGLFAFGSANGRFATTPGPEGSEDVFSAQLFDYDNDGVLDLAAVTPGGLRLWRNLGDGWQDVTSKALPGDRGAAPARSLAASDVTGDGRSDLILADAEGALRLLRVAGDSPNGVLRVRLDARVSNRSGAGSKIELRAGSLRQKIETSAATPAVAPPDIAFGLGRRAPADVVRVLWPSGILQAETVPPGTSPSSPLRITELDRKPSSCPYVFTWNGERFEFLTDFLGAGELGYWAAPGVRSQPDPDEYVRIPSQSMAARNGRYEIRVTNELEEAVFLDRTALLVVTHPADVEVFPNEGMTVPAKPFLLHRVRRLRPPAGARDALGRDVLAQLTSLDGRHAEVPGLLPIRGYAREHALTLDLGDSEVRADLLVLSGWTDYAFSSDNVAASQQGLQLAPPVLEVEDADGAWTPAIADVGIPVGRPQSIAIDLRGRIPAGTRRVRLVTNMRIYWDRVAIGEAADDAALDVRRLDPVSADLEWRGFSAELPATPLGPTRVDYARVNPLSPWKTMIGRYTREGPVRELLEAADDRFVVSQPGDVIAVSFDATGLPAPAPGTSRTFLLHASGYSKEMDLNSASPYEVAPMPYRGMTEYPPAGSRQDEAYRRYVAEYNTRVVSRDRPSLDRTLLLLDPRRTATESEGVR